MEELKDRVTKVEAHQFNQQKEIDYLRNKSEVTGKEISGTQVSCAALVENIEQQRRLIAKLFEKFVANDTELKASFKERDSRINRLELKLAMYLGIATGVFFIASLIADYIIR